MLKNYPVIKGLYKLSKEDIDNEAMNILSINHKECIDKAQSIPIEDIIEELGLNIVPHKMSDDNSVLGAFIFNKGKVEVYADGAYKYNIYDEKNIIIDSDIYDDERADLKFTEGHELGHYVLQYDLKHISNDQMSLFEDNEQYATVCKRCDVVYSNIINSFNFEEWQANYFSASILIPKKALFNELDEYVDKEKVLSNTKDLDKLNDNELNSLVNYLCDKFEVSKSFMKNRIVSLDLLSSERLGDIN